MRWLITAFQHLGIGVSDAQAVYRFYRQFLGFKVKLTDHTAYAEELKNIIGASVEIRTILAANPLGGAAVKLVEHISTRPMQPVEAAQWGDIGLLEVGLGAHRLEELYLDLKSRGVEFLTPVRSMELSAGGRELYAYLRDPEGSLIQLVEVGKGKRPAPGGVRHLAVGVSDMAKAREFYAGLLGFTELVHEYRGRLPEMDAVTGGKKMELVIMARETTSQAFLPSPGKFFIKLVHTPDYKGKPLYEGRRWGDIGLTEAAFQVEDLGRTVNFLITGGMKLLQAPARLPAGHGVKGLFAYVEAPDGVVLEMVEPEKITHASNLLRRLRKTDS